MAENVITPEQSKLNTEKAFGLNTAPKLTMPAPADTTPPAPAAAPTATPPAPADVTPPAEAPKNSYEDISDEELEKLLAKRTGGKVKSLADLQEPAPKPTAAELEELEKKEKQEAIEWALGNERISREEYETAIAEKAKSNRDIALSLLTQELRESDPKITAEEVEEIFRDIYHEDKDEDSSIRKTSQKQIDKIAADYRKEKFGKVDSIDGDFKSYKEDTNRHKSYTKQAKAALEALPKDYTIKVPITSEDGKTAELELSYKYDEADLKAAEKFAVDYQAYRAIGADKADVKDKAIANLYTDHLTRITAEKRTAYLLQESVKQAIHQTKAAFKNIPATQTQFGAPAATGATKAPPSHAAAMAAFDRAARGN